MSHLIRHIIRGCRTLPHYGEHPGTIMFVALILFGAVAGARGGWIGALIGVGAMLAFNGPFYLYGAYERSREEERINKPDMST